jgi:hypothetical protein
MRTVQSDSSVVTQAPAVQCEWVPGTMNQVRICRMGNESQISLDQLRELAGMDAVHEMYLKGLVSLPYSPKMQAVFK